MKILSIGMDKHLTDKSSAVSQRIIEYGDLNEKYDVITLADKDDSIELSDKVKVFFVKRKNKFFAFLKLFKKTKELLLKNSYDLITVQDVYFIGFLALWMAKSYKIGLEIQVHGFEKFKGIRKLLAKYVLKRANSVRVVSQRLKKQLISEFNVGEVRITVVPVYVKLRITDYELRNKKNNKFIFLTVGRLVPVKNIEMQIQAISNLKDKYKNIELWIIGSGSEENNLRFKIKNLKLEENVELLGYQEDLAEFYQRVNCFLLTSDQEGYGMVIIEAASYGLPIIMTDVGCAGEFIKDRENGMVIPIKDQKALEEMMEELIDNQELRTKLRNNAQNSVKTLLSKEETLNLYKESWEKAIKR